MDKVNKPVVYYSQKTFAIYKSNKSLIQKYKEHFPIHNENTANQNKEKNQAKDVNKHFTKEMTQKKATVTKTITCTYNQNNRKYLNRENQIMQMLLEK